MPFEKQYRFMKLLVERANMSELSPHVVRLDLLLSDPLNCTLTGFLFRKRGTKEAWSEKELAIIRDLYPETDRAIIERALPLRSWRNIITQASFMGLRRYTRTNTSDCSDAICYQDAQVMRKAGMHGEKTLWKLTGAHDISTMEADTILRIESVTTPEEGNMSISPLPGETNFDVLEREVKKWDVIEARMDKIEYDNDVSVF